MRKRRGDDERTARFRALEEMTARLTAASVPEDGLGDALEILMRTLRTTAAALFLRRDDGTWGVRIARGLPSGTPALAGFAGEDDDVTLLAAGDEAHDAHGLAVLVPVRHRARVIAVLALGRRNAAAYGDEELGFLRSAAAALAAPIESGLLAEELRRAHQELSVKAFELHNLFDLTRELAGRFAEEAIHNLVVTTVMGHFLVSRCALYLLGPSGLALVQARGLRRDLASELMPGAEARLALDTLTAPANVAALSDPALRRHLEDARMALAVPLSTGERVEGVLAIGERASGLPFSEDDRQVAQTLARQAMAALESARLQRVREEKLRRDRELQLARGIQRSLLPARPLDLPGFEIAGDSRPCFEVGGDSYDWIPLAGKRVALVVADVSGKGTPASLLMASAHAFVHALAGTAAPPRMIERLNRFLCARTQACCFVTLFYAELDVASRRLAYVNAGHVPPFRVAPDGALTRLANGGAALGLLPGEEYEAGELTLGTGDVLAIVTDGVTEAMSPDDHELGDERVGDALRGLCASGAPAILSGLVGVVDAWAAGHGSSDDLTALILKAR